MNIREITKDDASNFINLVKQVEKESEFMLFEPDERKITLEQQFKRIESMQLEENSTIFIAENVDKLVGYLVVIGGSAIRNKHSAYLVIGVLKQFSGLGIGTKLFEKLQEWSVQHKIHRLELTVMNHNERAISLYKKAGFEIEGTKRNSLFVNGTYIDEYYMSKLL
ncbi:GNAT family N-acetyltransferase [Paenibacillus sp. GP183]|uniref:GNAT family N-acetyltransferase n=1 Tax=Paenibacillus sp. GP183 TaxID=1882751 RepID=UPI0008971E00|nr:GNAT family N-acetyltransferase [Paenibacillus sp. GP183]SEB52796.1 Protein N-acetyltransferase, RimJ/RimL family [Paenibacillus sp. GP183]